MGAAHRKPVEVFDSVREAIRRHLEELSKKSSDQIREERYAKFRSFGQFEEVNL
jgi:acetyl-CoA carboxylase carboxyl transferase subunit alpha